MLAAAGAACWLLQALAAGAAARTRSQTVLEPVVSKRATPEDASLVLLNEAEIMRETGRKPPSRTQLCRHCAQYGRLYTSWSRGGFTDESRR
mmetsp:Transcript_30912/g.97496  ORF Transcript_30912/g.97496 Transcript_30912/m.97496 type:complete len:92 (-) Transcript_30912:289-564(-)